MTEPRRWLEDERNAPPLARELLRHARPTRAIDERALSISAALIAKLVATPAAAAALPLAVKLIVSASLVGVAAVASVRWGVPSAEHGPERVARAAQERAPAARTRPVEPEPEPPPAAHEVQGSVPAAQLRPLEREAAAITPEPEHQPQPQPQPEPRPAAREAKSPGAAKLTERGHVLPATGAAAPQVATPAGGEALVPEPRRETPAVADALSREVELLDRARTRLDRDPAGALALVEAHAAEFPRALLAAEREVLAIDALTRLGRTREAAQRAQRVLPRSSLYRERLRSILERPGAPGTR